MKKSCVVYVAVLFALLQSATADTNFWTGSDPSGSFKRWGSPLNWSTLTNAPNPGDDLWFLQGTYSGTTNDFVGYSFRTILIQGENYTMLGNPISLTGSGSTAETFRVGLTSSGTPTVVNFHPPIELAGSDPLIRFFSASDTTLHGALDVFDRPLRVEVTTNGAMRFINQVQGLAAIEKTGAGPMFLLASNTFDGVLTISGGAVIVSNNWALGTTAGNTVVGSGGSLVIGQAASNINEALVLQPGSRLAKTATSGSTRLQGPVQVVGPGTSIVDVPSGAMSFTNVIGGSGTLVLTGANDKVFSGSVNNTLLGSVEVTGGGDLFLQKSNSAVAIAGALVVGDDNPINGIELVMIYAPEQIANASTVTLRSDGMLVVFENETVAAVQGDGRINLGSLNAIAIGFGDTSFQFDGEVFGGGILEKIGAGTGILAGNSSLHYGDKIIYDGTLDIRENHSGSAVLVIPGARLTGNGSVANLFVQNTGIYQPGRSKQDGLNVMTSSNLNLAAGATFRVAIWGDGADQHGRASVLGSVNLTNAVLDVQLLAPVPVGSEFVLIANDGVDPVNGTFAGLPGGTFTGPGGLEWEIEYGNDVTLRLLSQGLDLLPPSLEGEDFADIIVSGGNGDDVIDPNECLQLYIPIYNEDSATSEVAQVTLVSDHPGLTVHQPYSAYAAIAPGDHGYNITPFQVSVPKNFECGTNLPMHLVIASGTNAAYSLPIGLPTGKAATAPQQLDDFSPQAIPDEGLAIAFVFVNNFTGHLAKAEVSVHITHPALETLNVTLVAPGDIHIPLALGQSGTAYGTSCGMENRTVFAADADTFIDDGTAPYVGTFRPVGILPLVRGMPESEVENRWYLWVEDTATGNEGTLECWSLFLYPAECGDGGGLCEACPEPINDTVGLIEIPGTGRLGRLDPEAGPTACGDAPAGDYFLVPGDFYYRTYTFYNQSEADTCVTVQLETLCTGNDAIISSAHLGGYNPALVFTNVLGYIGENPGPNTAVRSYSFTAPGKAEITIVVSAIESYTECGGFTLTVSGPDLCPAELMISPAGDGNMKLDWNTGAAGYLLQKNTSMMAPTNWVYVPDTPVVSGDRFVVTNEPIDPEAFFRLLKP